MARSGRGCSEWMRLSSFEYDLHKFYFNCYIRGRTALTEERAEYNFHMGKCLHSDKLIQRFITELEQDAAQESSQED